MVSSRDYALILSDGPMESLTLRARFSLRAYGKILDVRRLRRRQAFAPHDQAMPKS